MRVEESALIIRMKFIAEPGEQWVVRRVAYTRVRDALATAGIEFAHREVKVRMPPEFEEMQNQDSKPAEPTPSDDNAGQSQGKTNDNDSQNQNKTVLGAAAAAVTGAIAADLAKQGKIEDDDDGAGGGETL